MRQLVPIGHRWKVPTGPQWSAHSHAMGSRKKPRFSEAAPENLYLPVDPASDAPTVFQQDGDPASLLNRTRRLIALRHSEPALEAYTEFVPLFARKIPILLFMPGQRTRRVLIMLNPAAAACDAEFAFPADYGN